jgi:hypothetical protein
VISAAFKAFCAEKRGAGAWKDAEHSERYDYGPIVAELIKVAGDRSMGSLAIDHFRLFKDRVLADGTSPPNKAKKLALPAVRQSVGAGRCARMANSCSSLPAACKQMSCLVSDQSIPTKAANSTSGCGFMTRLPSGKVTLRDARA